MTDSIYRGMEDSYTPTPVRAPEPLPAMAPPKRDLNRFTLGRLDGRKRAAILKALLVGEESIVSIARRLHVSPSTVMALREKESGTVGNWKSVTARKLGEFVTLASERLVDKVDSIAPGQLPVALGIILDKKLLLESDPMLQANRGFDSAPSADALLAELLAYPAPPTQVNVQVNVLPASQSSSQVAPHAITVNPSKR